MANIKAPPTLIAFSGGDCIAGGPPEEAIPHLKRFADQFTDRSLLVLDAVNSHPVELDLRLSAEQLLSMLYSSPEESGDADSMPAAEAANFPRQLTKPGPGLNTLASEAAEVSKRIPKRPRGRPKLGVTAREVTLLPRHWEWLAEQPGGASVALRRLVEDARKNNRQADSRRAAQESAYRFMTSVAGNESNYEEAVRALYADDLVRLQSIVTAWPADVAAHAVTLAKSAHAYAG